MYLNSLHIQNFRCFADYTIEFAPGVTVLFGKNGAGKSSLINAIHKALSFAFDKTLIKENQYNLASGFKELGVEPFDTTDQRQNLKNGFFMPFISIDAVGSFNEKDLRWSMLRMASASTLRPTSKEYKSAYLDLMQEIEATNRLPFFAFYSDAFPHIPITKLPKDNELSVRNVGYWEWNQDTACSQIWLTRLERVWKLWDREDRGVKDEENALAVCEQLLKQGVITKEAYEEDVKMHKDLLNANLANREKYDKEVSVIRDCLRRFFKGDLNCEVVDIFISVDEMEELCLKTTQGTNPAFSTLPAGYKRLVYMVLDIAYRSYILNGNTDPSGVVLIDEIDLHLHPELEQVVLQRFMKTFPHVQFIVSTHSPLVLTGIETSSKSNIVLHMQPDSSEPERLQNVYGIDYNQMLEENMDVPKRNPKFDVLFKKAWNEVAAKNIEEAKKTIQTLEATTTPSDQTELVKLRAVISRLEIIGR